ncbi:hypothetical protein FORC066_0708 [Yersinia enterocolitica]|nr:Ferredoxin [Yersinia enterocolitica]UXD27924.1 hypothetical protein FORC066_0708 [Yersinia enterocolitica]
MNRLHQHSTDKITSISVVEIEPIASRYRNKKGKPEFALFVMLISS